MNTAVKMPLRSLNPMIVRDLQKKYPLGVVHIEIAGAAPKMSEAEFWDILALMDWGRRKSQDIVAPAVEALSKFTEADIFRFEDMLAEKLYALDGEKYAAALGWENADNGNFSVDGFLYARCCVVANGKAFYEKVFKNPWLMPADCSFEPLLYLAEKAHRLKTGNDSYDYLPGTSYETFSNVSKWSNMPSLPELIKGNMA